MELFGCLRILARGIYENREKNLGKCKRNLRGLCSTSGLEAVSNIACELEKHDDNKKI
jgi:hypothetical protein